jgi:hypothetical protein
MHSRKNAWRHGLSVFSRSNGIYAKEVEEIVKLICGRDEHPLLSEQATIIAECVVILRYVSAEKHATIERCSNPNPGWGRSQPTEGSLTPPAASRDDGDEYAAIRAAMPELARLDRYERRARSRRKRAILCLSAIRGYLQAISPDNERPASEYDPVSGRYVIKLSEPKWNNQMIDGLF